MQGVFNWVADNKGRLNRMVHSGEPCRLAVVLLDRINGVDTDEVDLPKAVAVRSERA